MITCAKAKDPEYPEGSYYVGQGAYTLEVLDRFYPKGSLNHAPRTKRRYLKWSLAKHKTNMKL
eukprot:10485495-Prorocentrum_lima.AAC.1